MRDKLPVRQIAAAAVAAMSLACTLRARTPSTVALSGSNAPSPAGRWEGIARSRGSPPTALRMSFDSSDGAWHGTLLLQGRERPVDFVSVVRERDSLLLELPGSLQATRLRTRLAPDGQRLDGSIVTGGGGTVTMARAGTSEASALVAEGMRAEASRRMAASLPSTPAAPPHTDPDSARLITSDIRLFWRTLDSAPPDSLAEYLERDYLERGTVAVRDFIPGRILSAEDLAVYVRDYRERYDSVRAANLDVAAAEPAIRAAFRRLKALYPDAVFPDVYFLIGRFNTGGTASQHGLLIGAEMYRDPSRLPAIVSHEIIHFQQHYDSPTLLEHSFLEGTADFLGEMICGTQINDAARTYGMAHEHALWQEFRAHFDDREMYPWMYGKPTDGRPNDLGYFIGYRIAQAYYDRAADKSQAIRDIISGLGGGEKIKELLAKSGYDP